MGVSFAASGSSSAGINDATVEAELVQTLERDGQYTGELHYLQYIDHCRVWVSVVSGWWCGLL